MRHTTHTRVACVRVARLSRVRAYFYIIIFIVINSNAAPHICVCVRAVRTQKKGARNSVAELAGGGTGTRLHLFSLPQSTRVIIVQRCARARQTDCWRRHCSRTNTWVGGWNSRDCPVMKVHFDLWFFGACHCEFALRFLMASLREIILSIFSECTTPVLVFAGLHSLRLG